MGSIRRCATKGVFTPVVVAALVVSFGGVAAAISGGTYTPEDQDCTKSAEAYDRTDAEHGCHNLKVNVGSGDARYAEFGLDQTPAGTDVHSGCAAVNLGGTGGGLGNECGTDTTTGGTGFDLTFDRDDRSVNPTPFTDAPDPAAIASNIAANGVDLYLGADDNLSGGEHDGVDGRVDTGTDGAQNGPSDGGAVNAFVHPQDAATTPGMTNPVPVAGAGFGSCADGICEDVTTYRHTVYSGTGDGERDAANYEGKQWDPFECDGASYEGETSCDSGTEDGPQTINDWRALEGDVYAQPGIQIYEDPDPQASPLEPYPLPSLYLGTCGVILQGEVVLDNPAEKC
ncbi:MAG: hypothetical protein QOF21_3351 [Actinomycetota bacterium]